VHKLNVIGFLLQNICLSSVECDSCISGTVYTVTLEMEVLISKLTQYLILKMMWLWIKLTYNCLILYANDLTKGSVTSRYLHAIMAFNFVLRAACVGYTANEMSSRFLRKDWQMME